MGYKYYDSPEGEDCFPKLWYTSKYATVAGLGVSTYDIMFLSHPQTYFQTIARYGHYTIPFVGMAAAFTSTVCVATSVRKKDDYLNYVLGGFAAGGIAGVWLKSAYNGFRFAAAFALFAVVKKSFVENGYEFFPIPRKMEGSLGYVIHDHTLTKERPRGWAASEN